MRRDVREAGRREGAGREEEGEIEEEGDFEIGGVGRYGEREGEGKASSGWC